MCRRERNIEWWSVALVAVGFLVTSSVALAQNDPQNSGPEGPIELVDEEPVGPPLLSRDGLNNRWSALQIAPAGTGEEFAAFDLLLEARRELGERNLTPHMYILLEAATEASEAGETARAEQLGSWARELAPDIATPDFHEAQQTWRSSPWAIPSVLAQLGDAYDAARNHPDGAAAASLQAWVVLFWTIILVGLIFAVVQVVRYFQLAAYDLAGTLSHVITEGWSRFMLVLAITVPAFLLASPLIAVLLGLVLVWPYQRVVEKIVTLGALGLALLLPVVAVQMGSLVAATDSERTFLFRAQNELCSARCRDRLAQMAVAHPDDPYIALTRVSLLIREGSPISLERSLTILDALTCPDELQTRESFYRGTALSLQGHVEAAYAMFAEVIDAEDPSTDVMVAAHFNSYRSLQNQDEGRAQEHYDQARTLDHDDVVGFLGEGSRSTNRWLMTWIPAPPRLMQVGGPPSTAALAAAELFMPVGGLVSLDSVQWLVLACALLFVPMMLLSRVFSSSDCPKCGDVMSPRDAPVAARAGYCPNCYALFMEGASLEAELRSELELRVDEHVIFQRRLTVVGNAMSGGLGFLIRGQAGWGMPFVVLTALAVVLLTMSGLPAGSELGLGGLGFTGRSVVAVLCLVVALGGGWLTTWLRRRTI